MPKVVIGLAGRKGSGKSAVASLLVKELGAVRSSFGDPLKFMLKTLGLTDAQLWGDLKEVPDLVLLNGKTPRHAMQTLGTQWGRHHISPNLWAMAWKKKAQIEKPTITVLDDVRFDNEVAVIRSLGGIVLGLERDPPSPVTIAREKLHLVHASENFGQLVVKNNIPIIPNRGSLQDTVNAVLVNAKELMDSRLPKGT